MELTPDNQDEMDCRPLNRDSGVTTPAWLLTPAEVERLRQQKSELSAYGRAAFKAWEKGATTRFLGRAEAALAGLSNSPATAAGTSAAAPAAEDAWEQRVHELAQGQREISSKPPAPTKARGRSR